MAWIKLDDHFSSHPKILKAGKDATILQLRAFCYAAQHLTDGFIPHEQIPSMAYDLDPRDWGTYMHEKKLWDPHPEGWLVHDYLEYNPSKSELEHFAKIAKKAGKAGAKKRWEKRDVIADPIGYPKAPPVADPLPIPSSSPSFRSDSLPVQGLEEVGEKEKKNTHTEEKKKKEIEPAARPAQTVIPTRALVEVCRSRFDEFFSSMPARNGKKLDREGALAEFRRLSDTEQQQAAAAARHYAMSELVQRGVGIRDPKSFLRDGRKQPWRDWLDPERPHPKHETVMQKRLRSAMGLNPHEE